MSVGGINGLNVEYKCLHLQKRIMEFTPGLENEDSFMVIPNKFVKDHELTQEEIQQLMTPDPEFERTQRAKYPGWEGSAKTSLLRRAKTLIKKLIKLAVNNDPEKILDLKRRWNRFTRRYLPSQW